MSETESNTNKAELPLKCEGVEILSSPFSSSEHSESQCEIRHFCSTLTSIHGLIYQRAQSPRDTTRYLFSLKNLGLYDVYE